MIFVSSSCVKKKKISESVEALAKAGFQNVELSGGSDYYPEFEAELLELKEKYDLHYRCHNYFPPPQEHFVLNLASLDPDSLGRAKAHAEKQIEIGKNLGTDRVSFHAGFLIDIKLSEIGKVIERRELNDIAEALKVFRNSVVELSQLAQPLALYIENNVVSAKNYEKYGQQNPMLCTDKKSIDDQLGPLPARLLLDVAHLKVSCNSLKLNFETELDQLLPMTDYLHISDNDGLEDSNESFCLGPMFELFKERKDTLKGKTFTLEIYSGLDDVRNSFEALGEIAYG